MTRKLSSAARLAWLTLLVAAVGGPVLAADARGCKDPAGLKRFEGSSLVQCETRDFGEYVLPTGKLNAWDYAQSKPTFAAKLDVEGRTSFNIYFVAKGPSSAEVFRNYKLDLDSKGYASLFEAKGAELGFDQGRIFQSVGPGEQLFGYSPTNSRYLSAVKEEGSRKTYVSLYVIEYEGGVHSRLKAEKGQVLVRLDVIEAGAMDDRMVVVSASDME